MTKNLKNLTKMLLIPTLIIGGLSACGYNNNGARTNNYDGVRPYSTGGVGPYNNNNFEGTHVNNYGRGMTPFGVNTYNYDGARPYNNYGNGYNSYNYNGNGYRQYPNSAYNYNYGTGTYDNDPYNSLNGSYRNDDGSFNNGSFTQNRRVARIAANLAKDVNGVTKATAVAHGRDIIVGVDVKKGANTREVERKVREKVQAKEPQYRIHVTSDNKIHTRIQTIYVNMNNNNNNAGHPVRALGTDVANIIRDIGRTVTAPFR